MLVCARRSDDTYGCAVRTVGEVLERLATGVDAERLEPIAALRTVGFRSRGFVGEYGGRIVAALYPGSRRAPPSQAGYDLHRG